MCLEGLHHSMNNLAITFKGQGRDEEAMALMEDCARMQKRVLGPDHPSTKSSQDKLNQWRMEDLNINLSDAHI